MRRETFLHLLLARPAFAMSHETVAATIFETEITDEGKVEADAGSLRGKRQIAAKRDAIADTAKEVVVNGTTFLQVSNVELEAMFERVAARVARTSTCGGEEGHQLRACQLVSESLTMCKGRIDLKRATNAAQLLTHSTEAGSIKIPKHSISGTEIGLYAGYGLIDDDVDADGDSQAVMGLISDAGILADFCNLLASSFPNLVAARAAVDQEITEMLEQAHADLDPTWEEGQK